MRAAFKRLALQYHPDRPGGSSEQFQKISAAHRFLLGNVIRGIESIAGCRLNSIPCCDVVRGVITMADGSVVCLDEAALSVVKPNAAHRRPMWTPPAQTTLLCMCLLSGGNAVAVGSSCGNVYEVGMQHESRCVEIESSKPVVALAASNSQPGFLVACIDNRVCVVDLDQELVLCWLTERYSIGVYASLTTVTTRYF